MEALLLLIAVQRFATRAQALEVGCTDRELYAAHRAARLVRLRHGTYTAPRIWGALDETGRHLLRLHAVMDSLGTGVVASHQSAALLHGLDVWGVPLDAVHVTRVDGGAARRERDVVHHHGVVGDEEVAVVRGLPSVGPVRATLETGMVSTPESFLVTADSLLHTGRSDHAELGAAFRRLERWPDTRKLHIPVRMADAAVESVGESRLRWLLRCAGIPAPVLQHAVTDEDGHVVGKCDLAWPWLGVWLEFDGKFKYGRLLRAGQTAADAVFAEKRREDRMREITGWTVIRVTWEDLENPVQLLRRIRRALRIAA